MDSAAAVVALGVDLDLTYVTYSGRIVFISCNEYWLGPGHSKVSLTTRIDDRTAEGSSIARGLPISFHATGGERRGQLF